MKLSKKEREIVYNKSRGKCWYCGCDLPNRWHVDHYYPIYRESKYQRTKVGSYFSHKLVPTGECLRPHLDTLENMVPSCPSCNIFKHSMSPDSFRQSLENLKRTILNHNTVKIALRFGIIQINDEPIKFWFEKKGKECLTEEIVLKG